MKREDEIRVEDIIGYNFKNKTLLSQAFLRRSYSEQYGGENNEVLEFIGDKALDFAVVKMLCDSCGYFEGEMLFDDELSFASMGKYCCERSEGELTEIKRRIVEKKSLADCIDRLGFAKYLRMSEGDLKIEAYKKASVKEDLFEAIIGAVALDSNWNLNDLITVVDTMLNTDSIIDDGGNDNYVGLIQEWSYKKKRGIPRYHYDRASFDCDICLNLFNGVSQVFDSLPFSEDVRYKCLLNLGEELPIFRGFGGSKKEARKSACKVAYNYLKENDLLLSIKDEIENPNESDAVSQLEILSRRGYFSMPVYDFYEEHDSDGNPIWTCRCSIEENAKAFESVSSSKKEAKKKAAYKMLCYVLN